MEGARPIGGISADSCFVSHSGSLEDSISLLGDCPWNELISHLEVTLPEVEREEASQDELWERIFSSLSKRLREGLDTLDPGTFGDFLSSIIEVVLCHIDKYQSVEPQKNMMMIFAGRLMEDFPSTHISERIVFCILEHVSVQYTDESDESTLTELLKICLPLDLSHFQFLEDLLKNLHTQRLLRSWLLYYLLDKFQKNWMQVDVGRDMLFVILGFFRGRGLLIQRWDTVEKFILLGLQSGTREHLAQIIKGVLVLIERDDSEESINILCPLFFRTLKLEKSLTEEKHRNEILCPLLTTLSDRRLVGEQLRELGKRQLLPILRQAEKNRNELVRIFHETIIEPLALPDDQSEINISQSAIETHEIPSPQSTTLERACYLWHGLVSFLFAMLKCLCNFQESVRAVIRPLCKLCLAFTLRAC